MKILHIISSYNGGIYSYIRSKFPYLANEFIYSDILAFEEPSRKKADEIKKYDGQFFVMTNPKQHGLKAFKKKLENVIKEGKYDVVHCHLNGHRAYPFYYYSKKINSRVPFIIHAHNTKETKSTVNKVKSKMISILDQFLNNRMKVERVSCSSLASKHIFGKTAEKSIPVLPNSIDETLYNGEKAIAFRKSLREKYHFQEDDCIIGQVGRLDSNKNQRFTLDLARLLKKRGFNFKWIFIGSGDDEENLKNKVKAYGLQEDILFLGRIEPISHYYSMMDAVIHPSVSEGFGIVPVEAQAAGKKVFVSDTVPKEVDLNLGLATFLSLNDPTQWEENLSVFRKMNHKNQSSIKQDQITHRLREKNLTHKKAAHIYINYIYKIVER